MKPALLLTLGMLLFTLGASAQTDSRFVKQKRVIAVLEMLIAN